MDGMKRPATKKWDLSLARPGTRAVIASVNMDLQPVQRLAEMGLVEGTEFVVTKVAPLGDPVEIEFRGTRVCLRRAEASGIELEPIG